jgi:hypothetical protein
MFEMTDTGIACAAQKAAHNPGIVVVIDGEVSPRGRIVGAADGTSTVLRGQHLGVGAVWNAVSFFALVFHVAGRVLTVSSCFIRTQASAMFSGIGCRSWFSARLARWIEAVIEVLVAIEFRYRLCFLAECAAFHAGQQRRNAGWSLLAGRKYGAKAWFAFSAWPAMITVEFSERLGRAAGGTNFHRGLAQVERKVYRDLAKE